MTYDAKIIIVICASRIATRDDVMDVESGWVVVPTNFANFFE
jgi:hypothetical protein